MLNVSRVVPQPEFGPFRNFKFPILEGPFFLYPGCHRQVTVSLVNESVRSFFKRQATS